MNEKMEGSTSSNENTDGSVWLSLPIIAQPKPWWDCDP